MEYNKEVPMEIIHKEIDLIQGCISRMTNNSFLLKGWLISILAVILAILPESIDIRVIAIILIAVILSFWYLDAYFLRVEKGYRKLYEWVIKERLLGNDELLYDLNSKRFDKEIDSTSKIMFSSSLRCFYGIPFLLIAIFTLYNLTSK